MSHSVINVKVGLFSDGPGDIQLWMAPVKSQERFVLLCVFRNVLQCYAVEKKASVDVA